MATNKLFPALTPFGLLDGYGGAIARADQRSTGSPYGECAPPVSFKAWVLLGHLVYTGSEGEFGAGLRKISRAWFFCLFSGR